MQRADNLVMIEITGWNEFFNHDFDSVRSDLYPHFMVEETSQGRSPSQSSCTEHIVGLGLQPGTLIPEHMLSHPVASALAGLV